MYVSPLPAINVESFIVHLIKNSTLIWVFLYHLLEFYVRDCLLQYPIQMEKKYGENYIVSRKKI